MGFLVGQAIINGALGALDVADAAKVCALVCLTGRHFHMDAAR